MKRTFYLLVCRACGDGDLTLPFGSAEERGKWVAAHTKGTGHDSWRVWDETRDVPEVRDEPLRRISMDWTDLVPITLVPIEVFGGDCECHEKHGEGRREDCTGWGYGLSDAVTAWSDCNRADGRIYRVDETDPKYREPGETVVVYVPRASLPWFEKHWGDGAQERADREAAEDADGAVQDTESSPLATGGRISAPGEPDDSVPVLLSEGGYLMYPHGDHSGPTAMDELGDKLNEGGPWMT